jgi:hypothetical protein
MTPKIFDPRRRRVDNPTPTLPSSARGREGWGPVVAFSPGVIDNEYRNPSECRLGRPPAGIDSIYGARLCAVDTDGNEMAGIRLPPIAVPLVTYTRNKCRAESNELA